MRRVMSCKHEISGKCNEMTQVILKQRPQSRGMKNTFFVLNNHAPRTWPFLIVFSLLNSKEKCSLLDFSWNIIIDNFFSPYLC